MSFRASTSALQHHDERMFWLCNSCAHFAQFFLATSGSLHFVHVHIRRCAVLKISAFDGFFSFPDLYHFFKAFHNLHVFSNSNFFWRSFAVILGFCLWHSAWKCAGCSAHSQFHQRLGLLWQDGSSEFDSFWKFRGLIFSLATQNLWFPLFHTDFVFFLATFIPCVLLLGFWWKVFAQPRGTRYPQWWVQLWDFFQRGGELGTVAFVYPSSYSTALIWH